MTGAALTETLFEGAFLRARLTRPSGGGSVLYVTFGHRQDEPGRFPDVPPVRKALALGLAHLHLQSRWNDWYLNPETTALETVLRSLRAGFSEARAVGYSMGGYAALRLAAALDLTQALVVSPQFSLDRRVIPGDLRFPESRDYDAGLGDLDRHAKRDLVGAVVFDPSHPVDPLHVRQIRRVMPGLQPAPCMFGGHPAAQAIRAAGGFGRLQALGLAGGLTAPAVVRLHRQLRRASGRYWQVRAEACLARGRADHAEAAIARAERLAGGAALRTQ